MNGANTSMTCRYHEFLRSAVSCGFLLVALSALAVPLQGVNSANRAALDEIVAMTRKQFGERQYVCRKGEYTWCVTNKNIAMSVPLDVAIKAFDEFATLIIFDVNVSNVVQHESTSSLSTPASWIANGLLQSPVLGYIEVVRDFFSKRESSESRMQPLLLFRSNGCFFNDLGRVLDEFDIDAIMHMAEWYDLQPDYYTTYRERIQVFADYGMTWTPWSETNLWSTPPYALVCKSMEEVHKVALYPYTNALSRVTAKIGGVTWMETDAKGEKTDRKLKRGEIAFGAKIDCEIHAADPPTYVLFKIGISPVGTFANDKYWEECHRAACDLAETAIGDYYATLWGRRDCYQPHVDKVIDGKSERECHPHDYWLPTAPLAPNVSRLVASNIWNAQILKCTPDALFKRPQWCTNTFDFANHGASRFSTTNVTAVTLAAYSNAIARIRERFLGTNMVACSSSHIKTPVAIIDIRAGIVPPVLDLRLDSAPCGEEVWGVEALKSLSDEIEDFVKTLPKLGKAYKPFFPRFIISGREVAVEPRNLSEKQLAGRLFLTGMYWSEGRFNVHEDCPPADSERSDDD